MIIELINKILFLLLFMSAFNVGRHVWKIFGILMNQDVPNKYEISNKELILVGLSLGYIMTTIFTGVTL